LLSLIGAQGRPRQRAIVLLEELTKNLSVRVTTACKRSILLIEFMPAARCGDHDEAAEFITDVDEGMRHFRRQTSEVAGFQVKGSLATLEFILTRENVERFILKMVDMQWGTVSHWDVDDKEV